MTVAVGVAVAVAGVVVAVAVAGVVVVASVELTGVAAVSV